MPTQSKIFFIGEGYGRASLAGLAPALSRVVTELTPRGPDAGNDGRFMEARTRIRHRHSVANAGTRRSRSTVHFGSPESGGFSLPERVQHARLDDSRKHDMTYRIGIIGGDGIGPEVVAEAVKCLDATGVALRGDAPSTSAGSATSATARCSPTRTSRRSASSTRSCSARSARPPARAAGSSSAASCSGCASSSTSTSTCARSPPRPTRATPTSTSSSSARTPKVLYAGEGGFLRKGTPHEVATQGSVNTRMGVERCVRFAFELARSRPRQAPHARAQDQRAHVRRRPVAAHVRRRSRSSTPTSTTAYNHVDAACIYFVAGSRALRRDRHRQHVRRHHHRPRRRGRRWDRRVGVGEPQPGPHRPVAVRAGPRLGARHRRHRARPIRAPRSCRPR